MRVLLIAPSGGISAALERLSLGGSENDDTVTVLSTEPVDDHHVRGEVITVGTPMTAFAQMISRALSTTVLGRNLLRLTPLDGGRRTARFAMRDRRFRDAVACADLIVVLERDGILAGWKAVRRLARPETQAVYGIAPAETLLKIERAQS